MKKRIETHRTEAQKLYETTIQKSKSGSFAHELAATSLSSHIEDLRQLSLSLSEAPEIELLDLRLIANNLKDGSMPLKLLTGLCNELRTTVGFAAIRLIKGGLGRKRIPKYVNDELDLRLAGIQQGSSRLLITASANRDLLDDGLNKNTLERIFSVLDSNGEGTDF